MPDFITSQILREPPAGLGRPHRVRRFLLVSTTLLITLGVIWSGYAVVAEHQGLLIGDLGLIGIGSIALLLVRTGWITAAIHFILITLLVWIPAMAYFVSGSGVNDNGAVHFWLFVYIVGLHFVLFDAARVIQTFYVSVAVLIFIIVEYNLVPLTPRFGFPPGDTLFGHGLTLGLVLIAIAIICRTYITALAEAEHAAHDANHRSEQLLNSMLPPSVVERVRMHGTTFTQRVDSCSVLFADIVGFTQIASRLSAEELVALLNSVFSQFDSLAETHGVEKIKTIGDGYMAACGLPEPQPDHAQRTLCLALDMLSTIDKFDDLEVRIGINSGPVLAGIIGHSRIAFDLWGETVNLASRMESHGMRGCVQVTQTTYDLLGERHDFDAGREIEVKGKGLVTAYLLRNSRSGT
ncbi:MAG: class 3 adenylate cyclase [Gammaproteobacteria bacterium]|jgi:class 3 adenylate cyclase